MALMLQLIQSNPKVYFDIKRNALKCLTVIFRDMVNYSKDSINMVLQPAWKLLNVNLSVYTELVGYGKPIEYTEADLENLDPDDLRESTDYGIESEPEDEETGITGMTMQLIELLTSLANKGSMRTLISSGIVPLVTLVASYMILSKDQETAQVTDPSQFVNTNNESIYEHSVRNYCLDFLSQMIENFDDEAIEACLCICERFLLLMQKQKLPSVETNFDDVDVLSYTYDSHDQTHGLKKREVAMYILGSLCDDILKYKDRKEDEDFSLMNIFGSITLPDLKNSDTPTILRGRAMWCATQLSSLMKDKDPQCIDIVKTSVSMLEAENKLNLRICACRALVHFFSKVDVDQIEDFSNYVSNILENVDGLLLMCDQETIHIPVSAMKHLSKKDEKAVSKIAHESAPRLLEFFEYYHDDRVIGPDLLDIFKMWSNYDSCKTIFSKKYTPFALKIVKNYFYMTNTKAHTGMGNIDHAKKKKEAFRVLENADKILDSSILQHSLDTFCRLLKKTDSDSEEHSSVIDIFPILLQISLENDDLYLLLHTTSTLRTFIAVSHNKILERDVTDKILVVARKMLLPETNEATAVFLGNFIIQIFSKIYPKVDTDILMGVVEKIRKCRIPTIVQSLVLVFARLFNSSADKIIQFLSETSVNNKLSLKVLLDKWLLHQPLFRGNYAKNTTFAALLNILVLRNENIINQNVVGYNPSHKNVKSEVNAPFKILSTLLRMIKNEEKIEKLRQRETENASNNDYQYNESGRLDTMGGDDYDSYDEANLSEAEDDEEERKGIEVDMAEMEQKEANDFFNNDDDDDVIDLMADHIKESKDKGLADLETGSEVYMSEMLGFEIEDAEEMEEQNEEDLISLNDPWGTIDLKQYVIDGLKKLNKEEHSYIISCVKHLEKDDQDLWKKYIAE